MGGETPFWERGGSSEGRSETRTGGGRERMKMHKQMLALGISVISSVTHVMTNSMENREEQKVRNNG